MRCCVCHSVGVEIHHMVPEADGGPDTEDNVAPLCPSCHDTYGANPVKRKFIGECKANWIDRCEHLTGKSSDLAEFLSIARKAVTKQDVQELLDRAVQQHSAQAPESGERTGQPLGMILAYIYDRRVDPDKVRLQDVDFVYSAIFGFPWENSEEAEGLRTEFLERFGTETARRLCAYELSRHPVVRFTNGFTDEDMDQVIGALFGNALLLLHHAELRPDDYSLELTVTDGGSLCGRLPKA